MGGNGLHRKARRGAQTFDAVVVGGGIVGLSTAYYLSERRGMRVAVLDRGRLGRGATWAAAGMLAAQCEVEEAGPFLTFALAGRALYDRLAPALRDETGVDIGLRRSGALRVAFTEEERERLKRHAAEQRRWALDARWLEADEVRRLAPALAPGVLGGVYFPGDGHVDSRRLAAALAAACARRGVALLEHTEVTGWVVEPRQAQGPAAHPGGRDAGSAHPPGARRALGGGSGTASEGRVIGVATAAGELHAGAVVLAGGSWSGLLAAQLGVDLPVKPVRGEVVALRAVDVPLDTIVFAKGTCYLVPKADGRLLAGATQVDDGFRNVPTLGGLGALARAAETLAPPLAAAEVEDYWSGLRPGTADGLPVLGPVPGWAGLYVAAGHFRNGILLGPLSGMIVARLIQGEPVPFNWRAFGLEGRFGPADAPAAALAAAADR